MIKTPSAQLPAALKDNIERLCSNGIMCDRIGEIVIEKYAQATAYQFDTMKLIETVIDLMVKGVNFDSAHQLYADLDDRFGGSPAKRASPTSGMIAIPKRSPILMGTAQPVPVTNPAPTSPHAPVKKRAKLPFWIKTVTSYDPNTPNGYGIKGKFLYPHAVEQQPDGTVMVMQVTDFKTKGRVVYMFRRDHQANGATFTVPMPNGVPAVTFGGCIAMTSHTDFNALFASLAMLNVPITQ